MSGYYREDSLGYIPTEDEQLDHARGNHADLYFDLGKQAIRRKWPPRVGKTFWSLLWLSKGRACFETGIGAIAVFSRQHRNTVQRALTDLEQAGWIRRQHQQASGGYWWTVSRYWIPRLEG